ncbi:hypothetical protein PCANC_23143 [Puccinia coronata f. sp. avenae]|uniref:Uncharacterized protein n=1 Tax=Puccinia coronata f. sp. avenae TaxID=200324 RepID=A0A2N5SBJ3_9BASI|nr:hypothetical protein PCANC_23143 [Puccinia coronata f. sp. avenae]
MTWVHRAHQAGTCASPANSEPADLLAGLLAELAQVPALQAGLSARRAGSSPASRSTCSSSGYQLSKQVYLLAELVAAQQAGLPAYRAGTSSASRSTCSASCSTCSLGWYQPSKRVYLLAELVPAQQAGQPARQAGTCTSPASRALGNKEADRLAEIGRTSSVSQDHAELVARVVEFCKALRRVPEIPKKRNHDSPKEQEVGQTRKTRTNPRTPTPRDHPTPPRYPGLVRHCPKEPPPCSIALNLGVV